MSIRKLQRVVLWVGIAGTGALGCLLMAGLVFSLSDIAAIVKMLFVLALLVAWMLSPYLGADRVQRMARSPVQESVGLVGTAIVVALGVATYLPGLLLDSGEPASPTGMAFLAVGMPITQWGVVALTWAFQWMMNRVRARRPA
jgi:quinol-cytochrome oxidoreductase complex cytochrome b subunit